MKKRVAYCTFILFMICQFGMAQLAPEETKVPNKLGIKEDSEKYPASRGILFGVHGARETMFELGYFNYKWDYVGYGDIGMGYSISTEHYINHNYIIAPKIAGFSNIWGINMGAATVWYFDMEKNNSFRIRPEIGIGSGNFKLTYAFNMAITNKDMRNVSKHMVSGIYFINFNRKAKKVRL
ncbi:hypothetical protein KORDIASMS9_00254 [Kordia sp. SMS9]|uniref:hypothetical protein n=1 Tax=Kordia sp. SMS9 TaxID=2282170 RepID=UPI000E105278|nr:hypothetical protein [Kordia sp. SMS9]AXG68065.1 hypothetical protein KORDIASMS9_00254 [Kordia sp. SMS9]